MSKRNTAVLVDGDFYLRGYKRHFGALNEPEKVAKSLITHCLKHIRDEEDRLYRVFFYDCSPLGKKLEHPLTKKPIDLGKSKICGFRNAFHEQLRRTRNMALRLGQLDDQNSRWKIKYPKKERALLSGKITIKNLSESDVAYYAPQKGVDMKVGLDIATLSYKKIVEKIVLISGDSDFVSASKLARREGIEFVLDPMNCPIKIELQEHIDALNTTLPNKNITNR